MICPRCGENMEFEVINSSVNNTSIVRTFVRLWLIIFTCGLWLLVPKKKESIKYKKIAVCKNCGYIRK